MRNDFHIARWHVQPQLNRISGADETTQVEPKIMRVLVYLAEHAGDVISREEMLDAVWSDVVVGEEVVSRSISELRKVFDDNPRAPEVIETIPKAGYRLIAPVSLDETSGDHVPEPTFSLGSFEIAQSSSERSSTRWVGAALALVLVLASGGAWFLLSDRTPPEPTRLVRTTPLTSSQGFEFAPALSPDGRQAAFIWTGGAQNGPLNVYAKLIGTGDPLQLTDSPLYEWSPTWSPDGRQIAFARTLHGLFVVPALGGSAQKLGDVDFGPHSRPEVDWSPAGGLIAFNNREDAQAPYHIYLLSVETGETQVLTTPPSLHHGDRSPAFSPDGRQVAFARVTESASDVYVVSTGGGPPRRLTTDHANVAGVTWTPDGQHLLFSSNRGGTYGLWRIAATGGTPEPVSLSGIGDLREPSLRGDVLAYTQSYTDVNVWRYEIGDTASAATALIASTRWDANPQFSPDGQRIAFASSRSGHAEIWTSDRQGDRAVQLTSFEGPHTGHPRWSPDGTSIAFDTRVDGHADVYLVNAGGGIPRRLTSAPSNDLLPSWSRDGEWVYFASNRSGRWQVWKMPAAGGEAVSVTRHGGFAAFEAPGGGVYYTRRDTSGLWRTALDGDEETLVVNSVKAADWGHWAVTGRGIYFLHATASSPTIYRYDFATQQSTPIVSLTKHPAWNQAGLTVDPNDTALLVTQIDQSHYDIVVTEYTP